jgi:hypothetical protein
MKQQFGMVSTGEGIQIDINDGHFQKAIIAIRVSLESDSNVTWDSDKQSEKHDWPRESTEDGIQIDFSAEHLKNAQSSILLSIDPASNITVVTDLQSSKQQSPRISHARGIITLSAGPKCRINFIPLNVMRESLEINKCGFPSSTTICSIAELQNDPPPISTSDAGSEIALRDAQRENALSSIFLSFDPGSNVSDVRFCKRLKPFEQINSTDAGIQSDFSEEQYDSALCSMRTSVDPGSNVNVFSDSQI